METLQRIHNRGSISTGYDIDNSCKFEPDNSEELYREEATAGNMRTWTITVWVKRTELSYDRAMMYSQQAYGNISFDSSDRIVVENHNLYLITNRKFRDTSAWYHVVWVNDSTQSTAANRAKIYINGVQETSFSTETYMSQNEEGKVNTGGAGSTARTYIGRDSGAAKFFAGYIAEFYKIDGTALAPTVFGEFDSDSGIWIPKEYIPASWGTQGNYLDFSNSGSLGTISGNGDNYYLTNISAADQATDTPTNNFCTLNPIFTGFQSTVKLPLNGATQYGLSGGNQDLSYAGTMGVTKGKWYFENYINEVVSTYGARIYVGFHTFQQDYDGVQVGASTNGDALAVWQMDAGNYVAWNGGSRSITGSLGTVDSNGAGKFVGIALNLDDNQISFYYDGSAVTNGSNLALYNMGTQTDAGIFAIPVVQTKGSIQTVNFGGYTGASISSAQSDENDYGTFEYAPPTGFYALCTKNLAEFG